MKKAIIKFWSRPQWILVVFSMLLGIAAVLIALSLIPKTYQAHARIYTAYVKPGTLEFEKDVLQSRDVSSATLSSNFRGLKGPAQDQIDAARQAELLHSVSVLIDREKSALDITIGAAGAQMAQMQLERYLAAYQKIRAQKFAGTEIKADPHLVDLQQAIQRAETALINFERNRRSADAAASDRELLEIRLKMIDLETNFAGYQTRYGPKHPVMIELGNQQKFLSDELNEAQTQRRAAFDEDARNQALRRALEQDIAKTHQDLISAREVSIQGQALPKIQIVISPDISVIPDPDMLPVWLIFAVTVSFLLSSLMIRFLPSLKTRITRSEDLRESFGVPLVGIIPSYKKTDDGQPMPGDVLAGYKNLRHELKLLPPEGKKIIAFTTLAERDDIASFVVALARLSQKAGERSIVVDCNLHQPSLQNALPVANEPRNLVGYLSSQDKIADMISYADPYGVHMVYGVSIPNTAADLLSGDKMAGLLKSLNQIYDHVYLLLPSPDYVETRLLAVLAHQTVLCIRQNHTRFKGLKQAILMLHQYKINLNFVLFENK